jgi:hypothetical protein
MVGKFRLFETFEQPDSKSNLENYLAIYSTEPLTRNEMINVLALKGFQEFDVRKMFRVRRMGKDRDPMFWSFGKIHGLENIAFADEAEIKATNGNPARIQDIVNKCDGSDVRINSFEHLVEELQKSLNEYKEKVESIGMNPSDKKKVLALPFYLAKRH